MNPKSSMLSLAGLALLGSRGIGITARQRRTRFRKLCTAVSDRRAVPWVVVAPVYRPTGPSPAAAHRA